jgi:hypothetical protein
MRVRLLTFRTGPDGAFPPGSEIVVSDDEGLRLIAGRQATPIMARKRGEVAIADRLRAETR